MSNLAFFIVTGLCIAGIALTLLGAYIKVRRAEARAEAAEDSASYFHDEAEETRALLPFAPGEQLPW